MYRRRRRFNGQWFPVEPTSGAVTIDHVNVGTSVSQVTPIVYGSSIANQLTGISASTIGGLALQMGQSFLVKRIVGSVFVANANDPDANILSAYVGAVIFTEREGANGALEAEHLEKYNPLFESSSQTRQIWRRTWLLGNEPALAGNSGFGEAWPSTNAGYPSIREGTHVDVKTKCRVSYGERLYFAIYAYANESLTAPDANDTDIDYRWNLKLFGKMTQYSNR